MLNWDLIDSSPIIPWGPTRFCCIRFLEKDREGSLAVESLYPPNLAGKLRCYWTQI